MTRARKRIRLGLASIAAVIGVVGGIITTSESIINSMTAIYKNLCSTLSLCDQKALVVDIITAQPNEKLMEKFGLSNIFIYKNKRSISNQTILISPDQDIFSQKTPKSLIAIQDVHFGGYFDPVEGTSATWWNPSFPILDITISSHDYKVPINMSELVFNIEAENSHPDLTPYLEVVSEERAPLTLTVLNQGWNDVLEAKIEYEFIGKPGTLKDVTTLANQTNPEQSNYKYSTRLLDIIDGKEIATVDMRHQLRNELKQKPSYYEKKVRLMLDNYEAEKVDDDPIGVFIGIIGRISAIGKTKEGDPLEYKSYFRSLAALASEQGFGSGTIDVTAKDIVILKSDLSILKYSIPITYRLDEKSSVYRIQIMLASDKSATYRFTFSLNGQGKELYRSPFINSHIFVPKASSSAINEMINPETTF